MENYDPNSAGAAAGIIAILGIIMIPLLIVTVIVIISQWKILRQSR